MSEGTEKKRSLKIYCPECHQKLQAGALPAFTRVNCPVCSCPITVPLPFDGYLLEEVLGEGGMATVYKALDTALNRTVAIKILRDGLGEDLNRKFLTEAKMAAKVAHPAVVAIYTCALNVGRPYIVMEYMDGITLEKLLQENPLLNILEVCEWIGNLAGGLERAEKNGIVHHDIKPANMLLNREGQVKIGDFGIAGTLEQEGRKPDGRVWGSPNYISPEKALTGVEDHTGDIYSLGASFYHLLTGQVPFPNTGSLQELLSCRAHRDPVAPHLLRRDIPEELSLFVLKMMHRISGMRPSYNQIRIFLLDYVRKNSLKKGRNTMRGAAFIPERSSSFSQEASGKRKSSSGISPERKSYAGLLLPGKKSGEKGEASGVPSAGVFPEAGVDPGRALKLRFLTAFGKLLLFLLFFFAVFGLSRWVISKEKNTGVPKNNIAVMEEKK